MGITINGSGTITGISQGGLPDDVITASDIKDSDYQAPLTAGTDYLEPDGDGSSLTGIDTSPPTTAGAVGTYAFLWHSSGSYAPSFGTTASGSSLYPSSVSTTNGTNSANSGYCVVGQTTGSQSGTWRCMGARSQTVYTYFVSLWIRIS